jgi:hypothetical protein
MKTAHLVMFLPFLLILGGCSTTKQTAPEANAQIFEKRAECSAKREEIKNNVGINFDERVDGFPQYGAEIFYSSSRNTCILALNSLSKWIILNNYSNSEQAKAAIPVFHIYDGLTGELLSEYNLANSSVFHSMVSSLKS